MVNTIQEFLVEADSLTVKVRDQRRMVEQITDKLDRKNGKARHGSKTIFIHLDNEHFVDRALSAIYFGGTRLMVNMLRTSGDEFGSDSISKIVRVCNAAALAGTVVKLRYVSEKLKQRFRELNLDFLFKYVD